MTTLGIKQNKTGSNLFTDHSSNWVTHLKTPPCTPWSFFFFQNPASQVIIKYQFLNLLFFYLSTYTVQQHNPTTNLSNIPIVFPYFIFPLYPSNFFPIYFWHEETLLLSPLSPISYLHLLLSRGPYPTYMYINLHIGFHP